MNIFHRIWSFLSGSTSQYKGSQTSQPSSTVHDDSPILSIDSALQISSVWACVSVLSGLISSLPLFVYRVDGGGRREVDKTSRTYKIFHDSPNKRQTAMEFWELMAMNLVLKGNAYARIERDSKGEVLSLWPLATDQVEVIVADDMSLIYVYSYDNKAIAYAEKDILHLRGKGNGVIGLSPLDYMRSTAGLAISAQNHTTKTYKKDARRPGILMSDNILTPEQRVKLKENFGDIATGKERELYVLEANFKFEPLGMTPADIQLLETRQFSVQDICRWFGVPSVLVNDTQESTSLGSSVEQVIDAFYKLTLRPQLERIEQAIYSRVLTPKQRSQNVVVEFSLDALLRASPADRYDMYAKAVQNGFKTRNECRKLENDPPIDGADVLTAQVNLWPVEMLGKQQEQGGTVPPETVEQ